MQKTHPDKPAVLYHYPLACSTACRVAAAELQVELQVEHVDLYTKQMRSGGSYFDVNPFGTVSALKLPNGELLTENLSVLYWLQLQAESSPASPAKRLELLRWLSVCASELHKGLLWVLERPEFDAQTKDTFRRLGEPRLRALSEHLTERPFLLGDEFSSADGYLIWFLVLSKHAGLRLEEHPALLSYRRRLLKRPAIKQVIDEDRAEVMRDIQKFGERAYAERPQS